MDNLRYLQRPAAPQHNAKLHEAQPPFVSKVGIALGTLLGFSVDGSPLVDCAENPSLAPVAAKCCADVDEGDCGAQVVVAFEGGDYLRPVVIGVLRSRGPRRWIEARDHSGKADHVDSEQAIVEPDGKRVILLRWRTLRCAAGRRVSLCLATEQWSSGRLSAEPLRGRQPHPGGVGANQLGISTSCGPKAPETTMTLEIRNRTPFTLQPLPLKAKNGADILRIVLKGGFMIGPRRIESGRGATRGGHGRCPLWRTRRIGGALRVGRDPRQAAHRLRY